MKVKVYPEEEVPEPVLRLRLVQRGGRVYLGVVDPNGIAVYQGSFLCIEDGGKIIRRVGGVSRGIGLTLDDENKVVIT